jgi:large subunit ribosomal protein L31e
MPKKEIAKKIEREYVIPLRSHYQKVARYKKTPKAVKTIKEFLVRHMQIRDRDLKKIKIDRLLNEILWFRGIRNPPHKIKVKAVKDGDIVSVYAVDLPTKLEFKKKRQDKRSKDAKDAIEKKKTVMQKAKETMKGKTEEKEDKNQDGIDDKVEEKEKQKAIEDVGQQFEKQKSKEMKQSKQKPSDVKIPKRPVRNVLNK